MNSLIKAIRGMNDVLPEQSCRWQWIETTLARVVNGFGYGEIRFPLLEQTALFKRSIGDVTDIVEKEMYSFEDRNGDSLSLRPEGTACCVRAALEHGLLYHQIQRLWYQGPFYRHERPQKGRYRQFHQLGIEAFGVASPDMDAEVIALSAAIFKAFGIQHMVKLHINSIGNIATRQAYREALVTYFTPHKALLDGDCLRRLDSHPLRILDSKNPALKPLIAAAPKMLDFLDTHSQQHHHAVLAYLDALNIPYHINPYIVRGLDYYNDTVFEWVAEDGLGAQSTVCAGGRYDGLVAQLGGDATPAFGFGLGIERLLLLLETQESFETISPSIDAYLILASTEAKIAGFILADQLRTQLPTLRLMVHCGDNSIKSQFKKADKSNARFALILGEDEIHQKMITVKFLREDKAQQLLNQEDLLNLLKRHTL
jgi:histidyl-tRNA synthetase